MSRALPLTVASSRSTDQTILEFGARVDAALAGQALERARRSARLDAFLSGRAGRFITAERDERGIYVLLR